MYGDIGASVARFATRLARTTPAALAPDEALRAYADMRRFRLLLSACTAFVLSTACADAVGYPPPLSGERTFLFIGNSLTYVNDVPGMLQALADSGGVGPISVQSIALPDNALVDHWERGDAQRQIQRGRYEWVVLQQGPSSVAVNRDTLRIFTRKFGDLAKSVGSKPALFAAWPAASRRVDFPRAIESYALAASDVGGLLLPVSTAWIDILQAFPPIGLYSDDIHANVEGSYLTALVMYARFFSRTPIGLPARFRMPGGSVVTIAPTTAAALQQAAERSR